MGSPLVDELIVEGRQTTQQPKLGPRQQRAHDGIEFHEGIGLLVTPGPLDDGAQRRPQMQGRRFAVVAEVTGDDADVPEKPGL